MTEDKTLRLIVGILLVIASIPFLTMGMAMGGSFGMMGGFYWPAMFFGYIFALGLLVLGIYLIINSLKRK